MNLQLPGYLQPLEKLQGPYPETVIAQAIERRDETIPHLIRSLELTLENTETLIADQSFMLPTYGVALLGFFEAEAALPILVALARHPEADDLLGDAITDLLPPALAGCAKSNPSALFPLIEDEAAEEFCRSGAVLALGTLHAHQHLTRDELDTYLLTLYQGKITPAPT